MLVKSAQHIDTYAVTNNKTNLQILYLKVFDHINNFSCWVRIGDESLVGHCAQFTKRNN